MFDTSLYQVITFNYDPASRVLSLVGDKNKHPCPDRYAGTTIDSNSAMIIVKGVPEDISDSWLEFAVSVVKPDHSTFRPIGPLIRDPIEEDARYYIVENFVLAAGFKLRKLPIQLVMRKGITTINSRNQITLDVSRSINALGTIRECYSDLMFKTDSWEWNQTRIYHYGSVVTHNGEIYISTADGNVANVPSRRSVFWRIPGADSKTRFRPVSVRFKCTEEGQETEWILHHGANTLNFVYSIRKEGSNEYVQAYVQACDNRDDVYVQFSQPYVGNYVINIIPCEETTQYLQTVNTVDFVNKPSIKFVDSIRLPRYVQVYDSTLPEPTPTHQDGNELHPLIIQNSDEGYSSTDVYFYGGDLVNRTGRAIFISPDDTKVFYFTNKGCTEPATIPGLQGDWHMIQMYDLETEERIWGKVTQDASGVKIELSSDRTFVAVLIEPTETYINMGYDKMWYYNIGAAGGSKYDGPVAVQCFDDKGELMYPAIYVDEDDIYALFQEGTKGRMLICGKLKE